MSPFPVLLEALLDDGEDLVDAEHHEEQDDENERDADHFERRFSDVLTTF